MKKAFFTILIIIVVINPFSVVNCLSQNMIDKTKAEQVLDDYFIYLKTGDTDGILNLLTGPFLKKRERLLRYNPTYGTFLKEKYEYAQFSIIGQRFIDNSKMTFDVQIVLSGQDILKRKFVIVEDVGILKIYSEEEMPATNADN